MKMIKSFEGTQLVTRFLFAQQDHDDDHEDEDEDEDDHDEEVGDKMMRVVVRWLLRSTCRAQNSGTVRSKIKVKFSAKPEVVLI